MRQQSSSTNLKPVVTRRLQLEGGEGGAFLNLRQSAAKGAERKQTGEQHVASNKR